METKQTAIEWVEDELSNLNNLISNTRMTFEEYYKIRIEIWVKAKQMEKEQIIDARANGFIISAEGWNGEVPCMKWSEVIRETKCEEYYNETYGKQDE
jgi:hypothetical protein